MNTLPRHRVEIFSARGGESSARLFDIVNVKDLTWSWTSPGGCAEASFTLPWAFEKWASIDVLDGRTVKIYWDGVLRYTGYIKVVEATLARPDQVTVQCGGFSEQLGRVIIPDYNYNILDIRDLLWDLLSKYAINTGVSYNYSYLATYSYVPSGLEFQKVTLLEALNTVVTLAKTVGNHLYDWYVDENLFFHFATPNETPNRNYRVGRDIAKMVFTKDNTTILNKLNVAGTVGPDGVSVSGTYSDTDSIADYGTREGSISIPHLNNIAEVELTATNLLIRTAWPQDRSVITLVQDDPALRARDLIQVHGFRDNYAYQVKAMKVTHKLSDNGLETEIQAGAMAPNLADIFSHRLRVGYRDEVATQAHVRPQPMFSDVLGNYVISAGSQMYKYSTWSVYIDAPLVALIGGRRIDWGSGTGHENIDLTGHASTTTYIGMDWQGAIPVYYGSPPSPWPTGILYLGYAVTDGSGITAVWNNPAAWYAPGSTYKQHQVGSYTSSQAVAGTQSTKAHLGETNDVTFTLPGAAAGLSYTFVVGTAGKKVTLQAASGDTVDGSSAGGTTWSDTLGDSITVLAVNTTTWVAISKLGTWTVT